MPRKLRVEYPGAMCHVMSRKGAIAWVILGVGSIAQAESNGSRPPLRKPKPEPGGQGAGRERSESAPALPAQALAAQVVEIKYSIRLGGAAEAEPLQLAELTAAHREPREDLLGFPFRHERQLECARRVLA